VVKENYRRFACQKCEFSISKHPGSRFFELDEVEALLHDKQIGPLSGFRSKIGRPFSAVLKLAPPEYKLEFDFGNAPAGAGEEGEPVDLSGLTPLGKCPKCGGGVFEQPMSYVCGNSVSGDRSCDFRSGKVILQQTIEPDQMTKLLAGGRTDILRNFVSNRTRRKFAAFLVWKADEGKVGFEFEPRGKGAAKTTVATAEEPAPAPAKRGSAAKSGGRARTAKGSSAAAIAPTTTKATKRVASARGARTAGAKKTTAARKAARR
jgi:DNA topoisomerase-3